MSTCDNEPLINLYLYGIVNNISDWMLQLINRPIKNVY